MTRAAAPLQFGVGCHELGPGWQPNPPEPLSEQALSTGPVDAEAHELAELLVALRGSSEHGPAVEAVAMALYRRQRVVARLRRRDDGG